MYKIKSFTQFLNEFELEGEVQQGKPLWNGKDYLDKYGDIDLRHMNLKELPCIFPEKWDKDFDCSHNQLTSLYGSPREVGGDFYCSNNQLTSLTGAPKEVGGRFYCNDNKLTSLEDAPKEVGGNFYCYNNKLTSLTGAPKEVKGNFICSNNKNKFTEADVRKVCQVEGKIYV